MFKTVNTKEIGTREILRQAEASQPVTGEKGLQEETV